MGPQEWQFVSIIAWVVVSAFVSRRVALDMDARGRAGWLYGLLTFVVLPLGVIVWLLDRNQLGPGFLSGHTIVGSVGLAMVAMLVALAVATFPWGLIIWWLAETRARTARGSRE